MREYIYEFYYKEKDREITVKVDYEILPAEPDVGISGPYPSFDVMEIKDTETGEEIKDDYFIERGRVEDWLTHNTNIDAELMDEFYTERKEREQEKAEAISRRLWDIYDRS